MRLQSLGYYTADLGTVSEVGRDGRNGPLRALWHVDPARCRLTGDTRTPLIYYPAGATAQQWRPHDFYRVVSLPSTNEQFRGLGFCAVSRCLELAKTMIAVLAHDQEQLGARAPKGLLLLHNISESQWNNAMAARQETLDKLERAYFGGVAV